MKKFEVRSLLALLLAAMLTFALVACGGTDDTLPPDSGTDPAVTEPTETDPVETDPVETDPVETDPPATEPVETDPPATEPVETEPPVTEPVETDPPVTEPSACEHKFGAGKRVNATCQSEGGTLYTCSKCGETKMENTTAKVDHLYTTMIMVYPSCTGDGESVTQCSFCGNVLSTEVLVPTGHKWKEEAGVITTSPTHHTATVTACADCGEVLSAKGETEHVWKTVVVADSFTDGGFVTYGFELFVCEEVLANGETCNYVYRVNSNHASGHYYEIEATTGKYVCKCGSICTGDFEFNGNEDAGPVIFVQD